MNYFAIFWVQGIVKCSRRRDYWVPNEKNSGITGNAFIKSTMAMKKWLLIDRCLQANLEFISKFINSISKLHWDVSAKVTFDDDLDLWKGKRGMRVYLPRKADRTGQLSWKAVDDKRYCWHMFFVADTPCPDDETTSTFYLKMLEKILPPGPYQITVDAGLLGSLENARYLLQQERLFIMSVASNKSKNLWDFLKTDLNLHHWKAIGI